MSTILPHETSPASRKSLIPGSFSPSTQPVNVDKSLDEQLRSISYNHPAVHEMRKGQSINEYRSVLNFEADHGPDSLTRSAIAGPDMLSTEPYVFTDDEVGSILVFYHLGKRLSGHTGIVHGGIPAVLLDEVMGRACFPLLASKIGVTARLELDYKSPIPVGSFILIRANTREIQGRKAWVDAVIEDACSGQLLVKATTLYIEPKWAAKMSKVV
jgi:acyl-coenzyme A thioesterase PaaI-like protein